MEGKVRAMTPKKGGNRPAVTLAGRALPRFLVCVMCLVVVSFRPAVLVLVLLLVQAIRGGG